MIRTSLLGLALLASGATAAQAAADPHAGHAMPKPAAARPAQPAADPHAGHVMAPPAAPPAAKPPSDPHAGHAMPAQPAASAAPAPADPHAGHTMATQPAAPADPHAGHTMPGQGPAPADPQAGQAMAPAAGGPTGAELPVGGAAPPPVVQDHVADRFFGAGPMQRARAILDNEHGATRLSKVMVNIAEFQSQPPGGGYRWDGEGWYGGDINRFVFKTEGEGSGHEGVEAAEVQALYSRSVARYMDVQFGVRHDLEPGPSRTYVTAGFEALFPYWFEVEGAAFLSTKGDLIGRLEGTYDLRLSQRLILQPQAELRLAAQDIPEQAIGAGVTHAELGLRLRYEIRREFAPYVGVSWERAFSKTADFVRARGDKTGATTFVVGLRTWF